MTCKNKCYVHLILTNLPNHHYIKEINVLPKCYFTAAHQAEALQTAAK